MKILIISDTHGYAEMLKLVMEKVPEFDALIHCGDIEGQEEYIRETAGCPCYMVAGNNDWSSDLARMITMNIDDYKIMITHGDRYGVSLGTEMLRDEAESLGADICFFGHTHRPLVDTKKNLTLVNPGSLAYPRQMSRKPTYGVMEIDEDHRLRISIGELEL